MPYSYRRDGIFNQNLTTIKDSKQPTPSVPELDNDVTGRRLAIYSLAERRQWCPPYRTEKLWNRIQ